MIDICDSKYDLLREELVTNGRETERWLTQDFMNNPNVVVANKEHFYELLRQWGTDPCENKNKNI